MVVLSAPAHARKPPSLRSAKAFEQNVPKQVTKFRKSAEKKRERKQVNCHLFETSFSQIVIRALSGSKLNWKNNDCLQTGFLQSPTICHWSVKQTASSPKPTSVVEPVLINEPVYTYNLV